jgi:hypothetical protein
MMNVLSDEEIRSTGRVLEKLAAHFRVDHSLVPVGPTITQPTPR